MGKLTIVDNLYKFAASFDKSMDRALNRMAIDVERLAKQVVPFGETGALKASGHHTKVAPFVYHTIFNTVYARYQEFGGDGKGKVVKKYSQPGKQAHYLKESGDKIAQDATKYFVQEASRIKI